MVLVADVSNHYLTSGIAMQAMVGESPQLGAAIVAFRGTRRERWAVFFG
jgi:hypothetical protein